MRPVAPFLSICLAAVGLFPSAALLCADESSPSTEALDVCAESELILHSRCLFHVSNREALWDEGRARLQALRDAHPGDPYPTFNLARIEFNTGNLKISAQYFAEAADGFAEREDGLYEGYARLNLADFFRLQERFHAAEQEIERAFVLAEEIGDFALKTHAELKDLDLARERGEGLDAILRRLEALEAAMTPEGEPAANDSLLRTLYRQIGSVLLRLYRHDEAYALYRRWDERAQEKESLYDQASARVGMAAALSEMPWRRGARDEVLRLARSALEAAEASGQKYAEVAARRMLGKLLPGPEGRAHLRRCIDDEVTPSSVISCRFALAGASVEEDPDAAARLLREALQDALRSESPWDAVYGWAERFRVVWATLPPEEALADSRRMLDLIEALRRLQDSERGRVDLFAGWVEVYHSLAGYVLRSAGPSGPSRRELEILFEISERMRARALLDSIAASRAAEPIDEALAEERAEALREIVRVQRLLQDPERGEEERRGLIDELDEFERALASVEQQIGRGDDVWNDEFARLEDVEAALADEEVLLIYQVAADEDVFGRPDGGSWVMAATSDDVRFAVLDGGAELEERIAVLLGLVDDADQELIDEVSERLYEDLLAPVVDDLPETIRSWTIVPDGLLHLLPFALTAPDRETTIAPSATLLLRNRAAPEPAGRAALVLADPAFAAATEGVAAERFAELAEGFDLGRLPYAREEGRLVVRRLGGGDHLLWAEEEASERSLKAASLDEFGIVHFAAHALVDDRRPDRSAVLLAAGGDDEDGLLQPRDVASLRLDGQLVVLSACRSAAGQTRLGEGVESLSRAFFKAGARTTVAGLWPLRDDEAAAFFDPFYRSVARGETVSRAVASARTALRESGAPPRAWAGIVVHGDGGWAPMPEGASSKKWKILGFLLGFIVVSVFLFRRRNEA